MECSSCTDAKNCVDEAFCADPVYGHDGIEVSTFNILLLLCTPLRTDANDESSNGGFKGFFELHSLRKRLRMMPEMTKTEPRPAESSELGRSAEKN